MGLARFPFLFTQPVGRPTLRPSVTSRPFSTTTAACTVAVIAAAGATASFAVVSSSRNPGRSQHPFLQNALNSLFPSKHSLLLWGSLSLSDNSKPLVESKTGASFPSALGDSQKLCGLGLRKKSILGLKNIDVYAFGMA